MRALTKFRGCLVIAEYARLPAGQKGRCPDCGGVEFRTSAGWTECCSCDFAILASDYQKLMQAADAAKEE